MAKQQTLFIASAADLIHSGEFSLEKLIDMVNAGLAMETAAADLIYGVCQDSAIAETEIIERGYCCSSLVLEYDEAAFTMRTSYETFSNAILRDDPKPLPAGLVIKSWE